MVPLTDLIGSSLKESIVSGLLLRLTV